MSQAISIPRKNGSAQRSSASVQRWGGLIGGSTLAVIGLSRRTKTGLALAAAGGALAYFGAKAHAIPKQLIARSSVVVNCSPREAFDFWRKFENLPLFMLHLESVKVFDNDRSMWTALGPLGRRIQWNAQIVAERRNELIAWRSLPDSDIAVDGFVEFQELPASRGTLVSTNILYMPPAGALGAAVAKMLGKDPHFLILQDLRRFKALIEAGEIPTTEGQPHGRRSKRVALARTLNPDKPFRPESSLREVVTSRRSVS